MSPRMRAFVNLLDIDKNGNVNIEDAQIAFARVDETVHPHGWLWTLSFFFAGLVIGHLIG